MTTPRSAGRENVLLSASIGVSIVLCVLFVVAYDLAQSPLAIAQAADSFADALTGGALLFALRVSQKPPDADHHFGHHAAQPAAALVVAVLVGVLGVEVALVAIDSIRGGAVSQLDASLAIVIGLKVVLKLGMIVAAKGVGAHASSAMSAFTTDARSDALLGVVALVGFFTAGHVERFDAWVALPLGVWIVVSGVMLAYESVRLLMGVTTDETRRLELETVARATAGVHEVGSLRARHHGTALALWVEVFVDAELPIGRAHDIGEAVESRLLAQEDVVEAVVHVDAAKSD